MLLDFITDGIRFAFAGGANTIVTLLIYQLLVTYMHPLAAYLLVWIIGILFLLALFPSYIYKGSKLTKKNTVLTIILYLSTLAIGTFSLHTLHKIGISHRLAIIFVLFITTTLNFFASRSLFRDKREK